jgi:two-component system, cell cycle sensor histidine kinase and response regulator CckA
MNLLDALQPLRRKLPLLITSLLFVVVAAASWSAYHHLERALILAASDRAGSAAQRLTVLVDDQMTRGRLEQQRVAALLPVVRFASSRRAADRGDALVALDRERTAGTQGPVSITLTDANRAPLLTVGRTHPTPVVTLPAVQRPAIDSLRRGWVGPFVAAGDSVFYSITAPVISGRDTVGFLISYRAFIGGQTQAINGLIGSGAHFAFGNDDGSVWTDLTQRVDGPSPSLAMGRGMEYRDASGGAFIGALLPAQAAPWRIVVAMPVDAALAPMRPFLERTAAIGILVLLAGALGAWMLSRSVTAPLAEVSRAAEDFAAGDYSRRAVAHGRDEIASMAASFNRMAAQVEASSSTLEDQAAELEAANEELRESELRYRGLVEHSPDAILVHRDMRLEFVNDAAARLLGATTPAELIGRPVLELVHPADRAEVAARIRRNAELRQPTPALEQRIIGMNGAVIAVETVGMPFTLDGQQAVLTIIRDVSERKRLEDHVRQAQRMEAVGQLAGGIAHDFNNLLTVITSYSAMLLAEQSTTPDVRADLEEIKSAADRAAALTRQLLAFSRRQLLQPRVLDVNELALNLEKMLRRLLREDIELVTALDPALGLVHADPGQLEQVIVNLAVNARDAMPDGGRLTIETANVTLDESFGPLPEGGAGDHVMLAVSDTGHGMTEAVKAHIFEPFFTTKETGKGTGLGLSTVYGIVQQSGGSIWVYSEPGQGTTFKIYLPLAVAARTKRDSPPPRLPVSVGSETILLVEDEERVRRAARRILEGSGYTVLEAATGAEAVRLCETHPTPIGLVLTDMVMPEMGGRELSAHVVRLRPEAKILFMSGYTEDVALHHDVLAPGAMFLDKPFTPVSLTQKVREALAA